jgi:hypothetical protein
MQFPDGHDLPLTNARKVLLGAGLGMFLAQVIAAVLLAPPTTGEGDADALLLFLMWVASIGWSVVIVLCVVRQADIPDIATAAMLVVIVAFAAFALTAAYDARGTDAETNLTDALFLGVTGGGLTAMIVWGIALGVARMLRLPRTNGPPEAEPPE